MSLLDELLSSFAELDPTAKDELRSTVMAGTGHLRWIPNPGPQTEAYFSEADELFYGGAAGGGKTDLLCGLALNEHTRTIIFRREGTDLRGVEARMTEIIGSTEGYNQQRKEWKLPDGRSLELGSCPHEKDKYGFQGRPHDLKAFDEITQFSKSMVQYICGWNRTTKEGQRCRIVYTGNPPTTPEGQWVKVEFAPWLDPSFQGLGGPAQPGELRWFTTDPVTGETIWVEKDWRGKDAAGNEIVPRSRTFIPAKLHDNPHYGADTEAGRRYRATLAALPEPLRTQLMEGDFTVAERDQPNQVIPTAWIRAAIARWTPAVEARRMVAVGLDVAQGGDDRTVGAPRHVGLAIGRLKVKRGVETPDGPTGAAFAMSVVRNGAQINVDMGGGFGQSTYDHLVGQGVKAHRFVPGGASNRRSGFWLRTRGERPPQAPLQAREGGSAPVQRSPTGAVTYAGYAFKNKRAEAYWRLREYLDPAGPHQAALPPDEEMVAELAAPTWQLKGDEIVIEPKEHVAERLGRSPDKGDAVVIAFASPESDPGAAAQGWSDPMFPPPGTVA